MFYSHAPLSGALILSALGCLFPVDTTDGIEPTHTVKIPAGSSLDLLTANWSPKAPPKTGDPSVVLGFDFAASGFGTSVYENIFSPPFELSGFKFTSSGTTSDRLDLTGEGYLLVDGPGDSRIEQFGLSRVDFQVPVTVDSKLTIYVPSVGMVNFQEPLVVANDLILEGFVWDDLSPLTSQRVDFSAGLSIGGDLIIRGAGAELGGGPLTSGGMVSVSEGTRLSLNNSSTFAGDLLKDYIPVHLEGGTLETKGLTNATTVESIASVRLGASTTSEIKIQNTTGFRIEDLVVGQNAVATIVTNGATDNVFQFNRSKAPLFVNQRLPLVGAGDSDLDGDESDVSIVPFLVGSSNASQRVPDTLVTQDPRTGEIRLLDPLQMSNVFPVGTNTRENVYLQSSDLITAPTGINALINQGGGAVRGSSTLTIESGILISNVFTASVFQLTVDTIRMPNHGYLWTNNLTQSTSRLSVSGDFTKSGLRRWDVLGKVTVGRQAGFAEGETDLLNDFTAGTGVAVANRATLRLRGGILTTPSLDISSPEAVFSMTGGTLQTASVNGSLSIDGGVFSPGNSPATTHLNGDYRQSAEAALKIEIGGSVAGTEFDEILVAGNAIIDGELRIDLLDLGTGLFLPELGDVFPILSTEGSLLGQFSNYSLPLLAPHIDWSVFYNSDAILLAVVPSIPGDYNADGAVDAADATILFTNWGPVPPADPFVDVNRDGVVDAAEASVVFQNWTGDLSPQSLPEPSSTMTCLLLLALAVQRERR